LAIVVVLVAWFAVSRALVFALRRRVAGPVQPAAA
jgi:hypothetical protein